MDDMPFIKIVQNNISISGDIERDINQVLKKFYCEKISYSLKANIENEIYYILMNYYNKYYLKLNPRDDIIIDINYQKQIENLRNKIYKLKEQQELIYNSKLSKYEKEDKLFELSLDIAELDSIIRTFEFENLTNPTKINISFLNKNKEPLNLNNILKYE